MTYLWMKDGKSLFAYCKEKGISQVDYRGIINLIKKKGLSVDEAVIQYKPSGRQHTKYYYQGIPISQLLKESEYLRFRVYVSKGMSFEQALGKFGL